MNFFLLKYRCGCPLNEYFLDSGVAAVSYLMPTTIALESS